MITLNGKNHPICFGLTTPNTELSKLIEEIEVSAQTYPEILEWIEHDQNQHGLKKKKLRKEDQMYRERQLTAFPGIPPVNDAEIDIDTLTLKSGRKRMKPMLVYVFLVLRAFLGSITSKSDKLFIQESSTIQNYLILNQIKMPGWSTIIDNINTISNDTLSFILDCQLFGAYQEGLDDFNHLTIDSTDVSANTTWPTDSGIILGLVARIWHCGQQLDAFGLPKMRQRRFPHIISKLKEHHKQIGMIGGKKGDKKKRQKRYIKVLKEARKAYDAFTLEIERIQPMIDMLDILPSHRYRLNRMIELMIDDTNQLIKVIEYCGKRINENKSTPASKKVMSLSDKDASYIKKGQRNETIGYKPQIGRSKNGFVTCINVPKGNVADSEQLFPMVFQHTQRTYVAPQIVSTDDGYASSLGKQCLECLGIEVISINGSKGKKLTSTKDWESDVFKKARNDRSSVESLMFTLKHNFSFDRVMRRGIENVRAEMLEKIIAYNFCRLIEIRFRLQEKYIAAAS